MGATNSTTYYSLSQFIATDKPAWLQDYNGDMLKIDTAINGAKVAADAAQLTADAAQGDATTALGSIATMSGDIATIQSTLGTAVGNINTINSLIGNGTPTTTDQTLIGAINEINAKTDDLASDISDANSYAYYAFRPTLASITADGVKTIRELLNVMYSNMKVALSETRPYMFLSAFMGNIPLTLGPANLYTFTKASVSTLKFWGIDSNSQYIYQVQISSSTSWMAKVEIATGTATDMTNDVPADGTSINIQYTSFNPST